MSISDPDSGSDGHFTFEQAKAVLEQMVNHPPSSTPQLQPSLQPWKMDPRRAELCYRLLVEKIPAVTFMAALGETDGQELYVSPQIEALLGFSQEEWVHNPFLWYYQLHPEDREAWAAEFARTCAGGAHFSSEYRLIARDGRIVWVHGECQVVRDEQGKPLFLQGVAFDITARKVTEEMLEERVRQRTAELAEGERRMLVVLEDLRAAKETAEVANQAKDHFLAVLSHELRTPLMPVLASVEMLRRQPRLPSDMAASLETIHRNVQMEARIIDDLLDLTRIARGKVELRLQTIDAHATVRHALEVCQEQMETRQIEVTLHLWARQHHVNADPTRLQQIFWNLIGNAVKFTPHGGRVTLRSSNDEQGRLIVEVSDTGVGIEPDLLPRLFNAFEQGERTITRRFGGLGLGLTISKSLMEMLGGTLTASSAGTGLGATFIATLPVVPAPIIDPRRPELPQKSGGGSLRLLLVEDHEDTLRVMVRLLRAYGYTVSAATTVEAAVSLAEKEKFDLLISDLGLPDGSGLDVVRRIKARQPIPGIALSGFGMDEDILRSKEAGFDRHMTKPVNIESLEIMIRSLAPRK